MPENESSIIVSEDIVEDQTDERSALFLTPEEILLVARNNRSEIRVITGALLPVSGLLLTTTFGVLYFILKDSNGIDLPIGIVNWVFIISFILLISIILNIASIYRKPPILYNKSDLISSLSKIYSSESKSLQGSIGFLVLAIIIIIGLLVQFASKCSISHTIFDVIIIILLSILIVCHLWYISENV